MNSVVVDLKGVVSKTELLVVVPVVRREVVVVEVGVV